MRRILGVAAAAAMAFMVSGASADEATGTVSNINTTANTFQLHGRTYTAGDNNVVGTKVSEMEEGKQYRVTFSSADSMSGRQPINVMTITPEE